MVMSCKKSDVNPVTKYDNAPCENNLAGNYPCWDYDLIGHFSLDQLGEVGISGNDCWGWTDPESSKEYALMGISTGTSFIDISNPEDPKIIGFLPTHTSSSDWRDIKTYGNHAFIVSEAEGHGMQVFDLSKLPSISPASEPVIFSSDAHYSGFGNAHNIVINESKAYAYAVGTETFNGGPHFIDISDPLNPIAAGGYADGAYSHDAQVITYTGPDEDYTEREILIGSNESKVVLVDITNKNNPTEISSTTYSNIGYTHQGWFTEDQKYFILGDEYDEKSYGINSRNVVFDFTDLDNPVVHMEYYGQTTAIDHNGYVLGDYFYMANYTAGVRIIDISNIANKQMEEVGYFDTYLPNDLASFNGVWSVYPFFKSENIILSDINSGFYIIRKSD